MKNIKNMHSSVFSFLWYFVRQQKYVFFIQSLLCFSWAIKETLVPVFIKNMINIASNNSGSESLLLGSLLYQIICFLMVWILMEFSMRFQKILALKSFPILKAKMRQFIFDYVINHSYDYFNTVQVGSIVSKVSELPRAAENLIEIVLVDLVAIGSSIIIGIVILWTVDIRFAGLFFMWLLLHLGISLYCAKNCHDTYEDYAGNVTNINGRISDVFSNILNVFLFSQTKYESDSLKAYQEKKIYSHRKARWSVEKLKIYQGIFTILYLTAMLICLVFGWLGKTVSIGDFSLIPMLSCGLLGMVWWFSNQIHISFREIGSIKSSLRLFDIPNEVDNQKNLTQLNVIRGEIRLDKVSFKYSEGTTIFNEVSLYIPAKQKVGIAGLSGAGKSTFIYLLLRLYNIDSGKILIDEQNITEVTKESLRSQITVIPQDFLLFNRTIFENILYGKQNASESEIYAAAKLAGCHEFIEEFPLKYQTLAGEKGVKLSGGQRQRIGIARAILKNSPILVLDEPTSSLDVVTRNEVQENLEKLMENKTVIFISHLATDLQKMDRLLVFKDGGIIEDNGNPSQMNETSLIM